jgi:hypothetical protein
MRCGALTILPFAVTALLTSSLIVQFCFLFRLLNCLFSFLFTNNFGLVYSYLLHVTLIFHTDSFRLHTVHFSYTCNDSSYHVSLNARKLNSLFSVAGPPCACTLNTLAASERKLTYFPLSAVSRKWRAGSRTGCVSFEFITVRTAA